MFSFFFQAEDGIRDLVRSRGLGDVYKRQVCLVAFNKRAQLEMQERLADVPGIAVQTLNALASVSYTHLTLPTIYSV